MRSASQYKAFEKELIENAILLDAADILIVDYGGCDKEELGMCDACNATQAIEFLFKSVQTSFGFINFDIEFKQHMATKKVAAKKVAAKKPVKKSGKK
jgi:hypothetical protein